MKKLILMIAPILCFCFLGNHETVNDCISCSDCNDYFYILEDSSKIDTVKFTDVTVREFEALVRYGQYEDEDVLIDYFGRSFFTRSLMNGYNLKIILAYPANFSFQNYGFDYYQATHDDRVKIYRDLKVKRAYLYKYRDCISNKLVFEKSYAGEPELKFDF